MHNGLIDYNHIILWLQECCKQIKIWIKTTTSLMPKQNQT